MAGTTVDGLITGLDTSKLIDGLLSVQKKRIELLKTGQDKVTQQQTAFKGIEARLLALRSKIGQLGRAQSSVFDIKTVASSNSDVVTAAAGATAIPGVYSIKVNNLAGAHQIASEGFEDSSSSITTGTLQLKVGTGATTTITIDSTNNTLLGLAGAINNASTDVNATVINDGSGTESYRLVLTSKKSGASNAISITNNLAADSGAARRVELSTNYVGNAIKSSGFTGDSLVTSNAGSGGYTGTTNENFSFTVRTGGTVGSTDGILIDYSDRSGTRTGTITLNAADLDTYKSVLDGVQVKFGAGTLVAGDKFSIDEFVPTVQAAIDASVTLGSGLGAITVQTATNQVDSVIAGVSLKLNSAAPATTVQLTVGNEIKSAKDTISEFVTAYNDLLEFIDDQVKFDGETNKAGLLLGNRTTVTIQDDVRRVVNDVVKGVNSQLNRLNAIGITTNSSGRLDVDSAKLEDALNGRINGATFDDVRRLFALAGKSSNSGIQFITGGARTKASTPGSPYQVDISQAATQAAITGNGTLAASTVIDNTNNTLTIRLDGKLSSTITLTAGTYTRQALAAELQSQINGNPDLSGKRVAANLNVGGDKFVLTSQLYGFASEVKVGTGTALAALGLDGTEQARGTDVVGKFIVDGVAEDATGSGTFLIGKSDNANTGDLQVRVTLNPSQIIAGSEATLDVTRGLASKLDVALGSLLDPISGRIKTVNDGFQRQIDDYQKSIKTQTKALETKQQSLLLQFVNMERTVGKLKSTGDYLSAQLASFTSSLNKSK